MHFQLFASPWTPTAPRLSFQMMEEQPIGTKLAALQATDADSNIEEYRLSENDYFAINNLTGSFSFITRIINNCTTFGSCRGVPSIRNVH